MFVDSSPSIPAPPFPPSLENIARQVVDHQEDALANLTWKQGYLTLIFREWVDRANEMNININKQIHKMESVIRDQPGINCRHQQEVWLLYETNMLNIITSQIVRRIAKTRIQTTAKIARGMPELQLQIGLINMCERFLLKRLPQKLPEITPAETAIGQYWAIHHELEKMTEKILGKAKPPIKKI